jgi:hypothetical protein
MANGFDGIPKECLRHLPTRPHVYVTRLFNHCLPHGHFPAPWKEAKVVALPKPDKDTKFPPNLSPISLLSTPGKLFERTILRTIQKHTEERNLQMQVSLAFEQITARHFVV